MNIAEIKEEAIAVKDTYLNTQDTSATNHQQLQEEEQEGEDRIEHSSSSTTKMSLQMVKGLKHYHVLAPMVRAGTLPLRLVSLYYGADRVYGEEIIDHKMKNVQRVVNEELNCIDFVMNDDSKSLVYRTYPEIERGKNIFQIGSSDATRALYAAQLVQNDVAGVDLNMGCPKHFSIQDGMGASLLKTPEIAEDILRTLRKNLSIPVTCKIRLLENQKDTIELVRRLEKAGAQTIGVHMRLVSDRPSHPADWNRLKEIVDSVSVPIIANGDCWTKADGDKIIQLSGANGAMYARGALRNPSECFNENSHATLRSVMRSYARVSVLTDNHFSNSKYTMMRMLSESPKQKGFSEYFHKSLPTTKSFEDLFAALGITDEWNNYYSPSAPNPVKLSRKSFEDCFKVSDNNEDPFVMHENDKSSSLAKKAVMSSLVTTLLQEPNTKRQKVGANTE